MCVFSTLNSCSTGEGASFFSSKAQDINADIKMAQQTSKNPQNKSKMQVQASKSTDNDNDCNKPTLSKFSQDGKVQDNKNNNIDEKNNKNKNNNEQRNSKNSDKSKNEKMIEENKNNSEQGLNSIKISNNRW